MRSIRDDLFLVTHPKRLDDILEEFPRANRLERVLIREGEYRKFREALLRTLEGKIALIIPFPLRPTISLEDLSKQMAFVLAAPRKILVSLYPRPEFVLRIAKEPLILGDMLISPGSLRRLIEK